MKAVVCGFGCHHFFSISKKKSKWRSEEGAKRQSTQKQDKHEGCVERDLMPAMSSERRCVWTCCLLFFLATVQAGAGWSHLRYSKTGVGAGGIAGSPSVAEVSSDANGKLAPHPQTDSPGVRHVLSMTIIGPDQSIVIPRI